ncbi:MAG TPA: N-acetylmuramoyl-L-alanine amidase [Syntrophomonas sp.]|nr:N-acetylmuramoyl-L-alanine amidase [Syntrophomonas sp.]HRW13134.1 N-acetylmuramoyl-L-alanine amidase [Syntrophomonas sp.]
MFQKFKEMNQPELQYKQAEGRILLIRKKNVLILAMVIFVLLMAIVLAGNKTKLELPAMSYVIAGQVIAVDAGHGGIDPGAIAKDKQEEKDITLAISKKLVRYLNQAGAQAVNLRTGSGDLCGPNFQGSIRERKRHDLALRVEKAQKAKADLYISIHTNADLSPRWSGAQTFYKAGQQQSEITAIAIQDELTRILGNTNRKAKTGSYYILDKAGMPIVIVEVGFLSNPREARLLSADEYQEKLAFAIFCGIVKSYLPEEKSSNKLE